MKKTTIKYALLFVLFLLSGVLHAQPYQQPLNISPALSGNFGELRNNHFHSGIDYKTQQVENKPIFAIADGYVSRISVSPGGYGLALYITHPATGHTSVYAHLNSFSKKIADYTKNRQYKQETFRINIPVPPNEISIKKGEQIALSGNTGNSGGAHLHFEIRDTETQDPLDVLQFLGKNIVDTQKPDIRGIAFYPIQGKGVINGASKPLRVNIGKNKSGLPQPLTHEVSAWGRIGVGVKAYDRMDRQKNIYGVKNVRLFVDDVLTFNSVIERFSFDKTRMLNSFVDFEEWRQRKSFYMKSFIEPGNTLSVYTNTKNNGYIDIHEERAYRLRYELEDHYGNTLIYAFTINGKKQPVPELPDCTNYMAWGLPNTFITHDFVLTIPAGSLYADVCYTHTNTKTTRYFSDIHQVNNAPVPLHKEAVMWIKIDADTLQNRQNYGIVSIQNNGTTAWVGGTYKNKGIETTISELGYRYAVDMDTIAPNILPQHAANWAKQGRIGIRLTDDKSGIAQFRGTINGNFVLFTHDVKSNLYTYVLDDTRLTKGEKQRLVFTATDGAGNTAEYSYEFEW